MRERAAHHPHQTDGMREAIAVFDEWLINFTDPTAEERKAQRKEWEEFNRLCNSVANQHAYGKEPTPEELKRARQDLAEGQKLLADLLSAGLRSTSLQSDLNKNGSRFPITKFTALFGGPGIHGYGEHTVTNRSEEMGNSGAPCCYASSQIDVHGLGGIEELIGKSNTTKLGLFADDIRVRVIYNRNEQTAIVEVERGQSSATLKTFWGKGDSVERSSAKQTPLNDDEVRTERNDSDETSWTCTTCTFVHEGKAKESFLACELCGSERRNDTEKGSANNGPVKQIASAPAAASSPTSPSSWGCLRAPTQEDITGPRKRRKGLDEPPPMMDYLIVLDFEWTADDKRKMEPVAEITQFPSVVMKLCESKMIKKRGCVEVDGSSGGEAGLDDVPISNCVVNDIPRDLRPSPAETRRDAHCVSIYDTFVQPTLNSTLTKFSIELTGITQDEVDRAPAIDQVIADYMKWLRGLGLVDEGGNRVGNWSFATWSDADLSILGKELQHKSIDLPPCFDRWVNLKDDSVFQKHYHREPRGGLRTCVESIGARWEGRAHNGLVDSINTAKIVRDMVRTGFRFTRSTRGLDCNGVPFGRQQRGQGEGKQRKQKVGGGRDE